MGPKGQDVGPNVPRTSIKMGVRGVFGPLQTHENRRTGLKKVRKRRIKPTPLTSLDYAWYIRSEAWKEVKKRYLATKAPRHCFVCRKQYEPSFQFHHRTYKRLGSEKTEDIHPICVPCHKKLHGRNHA